jgi:hypothetical protein
LGRAAAAKGQGDLNALDMGGNSSGFGRARSCPVNVTKGAKNAAHYPKMLDFPQSVPRRLAPPLFLPAASSHYEVLTAARLDKADAACAEANAARPDEGLCHAAPRLSLLRLLLTHLTHLSFL